MLINTFSTSCAGNVNRSRFDYASWKCRPRDTRAPPMSRPRRLSCQGRAGVINAGITASYVFQGRSRDILMNRWGCASRALSQKQQTNENKRASVKRRSTRANSIPDYRLLHNCKSESANATSNLREKTSCETKIVYLYDYVDLFL